MTSGSTSCLVGRQIDHIGVWQHFGNSILSLGNSRGGIAGRLRSFGGLGTRVVQGVGDLVEPVLV